MAKLEQVISGDFYEVLGKIERGIVEGSMSASLEEFSDFESGTARCSVRVFERYSYVGDNRVSLNVTLFQNGSGPIQLSAIAAGGCLLIKQLSVTSNSYICSGHTRIGTDAKEHKVFASES